jgi:gas vesicle protein
MLIFKHIGGQIMRGFSKTDALRFFLTGAAVGAAVGLVFAPKSGSQTRKDIRRFSKKAANRLDDLQCDVREQITESYEQVMEVFDNVKEYVEDGKSKLQRIVRTA